MITIEDGVPIIAGRRFPWVKKIWPANEQGAVSFDLMMENGWTAKVYFFPDGEDDCAVTGWSCLGQDFWADDRWADGGWTARKCLDVIDYMAQLGSDDAENED